MIRVFPIATTTTDTVPGFSDDWTEKHRGIDISSDKGSPVVSVDAGDIRLDLCTKTLELHALDGAVYNYGHIERVGQDRAVRVGEIIGRVSETGRVHFETKEPDGTSINPYSMLIVSPNLFIPRSSWWKLVAQVTATAAAGLGVGYVAAKVYYETTDESRPKLDQSPHRSALKALPPDRRPVEYARKPEANERLHRESAVGPGPHGAPNRSRSNDSAGGHAHLPSVEAVGPTGSAGAVPTIQPKRPAGLLHDRPVRNRSARDRSGLNDALRKPHRSSK